MFLVLCAGVGYRWHDYLGVRKHLLELDGETIIARTVRQLHELGHRATIVGPDDDRYRFPDADLHDPADRAPTDTSVDKILSARGTWNTEGPTTLMWGDVWWSDEAIASMSAHDGDDWHVWYREAGSHLTGTDHGEFFALRFQPQHHDAVEAACWRVVDLYKRGLVPWLNTGAWSHYRAMLGLPDAEVHGWHDGRNATLVDDLTDDFDAPIDYRTWYGRRAAGRYPIEVRFHDTGSTFRRQWPASEPEPKAVVDVHGDHSIEADQLWCAVAHAVEQRAQVIPYSDMAVAWGCDAPEPDPAVIVTPTGEWSGTVRVHGHLS